MVRIFHLNFTVKVRCYGPRLVIPIPGISLILISIFWLSISHLSYAALYKCLDDNDNVIYSDNACINTKKEKLDLVIPPVDKPSAERLKRLPQLDNDRRHSTQSPVIVIKPEQVNSKCNSYTEQISNLKSQLNSGYNREQGIAIENSIKSIREQYNKNCR